MKFLLALIVALFASAAQAQQTQLLWGYLAGAPSQIQFKIGATWYSIGTFNGTTFTPNAVPLTQYHFLIGNASNLATDTALTGDCTFGVSGILCTKTNGVAFTGAATMALPVAVGNGGTGTTTFTSHGVLLGNAGTAVSATAAGTDGQLLLGISSLAPAFATMSGYGSISNTGTLTVGKVKGTATNDNATAGDVGEYKETVVSSPVSASTGVAFNVGSISLTAGDWDCNGQVNTVPAGTTRDNSAQGGLSTTSATMPTSPDPSFTYLTGFGVVSVAGTGISLPVGMKRFSLAGTTTVYLVGLINFTISTDTAIGYIRCRRVR